MNVNCHSFSEHFAISFNVNKATFGFTNSFQVDVDSSMNFRVSELFNSSLYSAEKNQKKSKKNKT